MFDYRFRRFVNKHDKKKKNAIIYSKFRINEIIIQPSNDKKKGPVSRGKYILL